MMFWTCAVIFISCEIGELVTQQFEKIHAEFGQCNWYLYPIGMRKLFVIFLSNVQQPTLIRGFGNILYARSKVKEVKNIPK